VERIGFRTRSCLLCGRKLFVVVGGSGRQGKRLKYVAIDLGVRLWHTIALAV
jgi:hypothetical protein